MKSKILLPVNQVMKKLVELAKDSESAARKLRKTRNHQHGEWARLHSARAGAYRHAAIMVGQMSIELDDPPKKKPRRRSTKNE